MCFQHKAVMIFERVLGVDHPDTVAAYVSYINVITVFHETFRQENSLSMFGSNFAFYCTL